MDRLRDERTRDLLTRIWTDPHSLDPSKISAKVTREIAERLAKLAKSLEAEHEPEVVAGFLMRCLFTMFAEDVELLRPDSFTELLLSLRTEPQNFKPMAEALWASMDEGTFSTVLREKVKQFNGKFFKDKTALDLNHDQVELLNAPRDFLFQITENNMSNPLGQELAALRRMSVSTLQTKYIEVFGESTTGRNKA